MSAVNAPPTSPNPSAPRRAPLLLKKGIEAAMVICLVVMSVLVLGNVILRYAFNSGIGYSEEVSRYLFVWLTFIGAVVGMHEHAHLGMDSVVHRLPPLGKKIFLALSELLMLGCCWLLLDGSWKQTIVNLDNHAPVSGLPLAYVYAVGVFTAIAIGLLLLRSLFRLLTGNITEEELIQVRESEAEISPVDGAPGVAEKRP